MTSVLKAFGAMVLMSVLPVGLVPCRAGARLLVCQIAGSAAERPGSYICLGAHAGRCAVYCRRRNVGRVCAEAVDQGLPAKGGSRPCLTRRRVSWSLILAKKRPVSRRFG